MLAIAAVLLAGSPYIVNAQSNSAADIKIENYKFVPATLAVTIGTTVTWTNRDDDAHKIVNKGDLFKSNDLDKDQKFSYTFSKAGTYPYFCSIHSQMSGTVVVH